MSTMHRTFPTRYEYFEAWLTPEEWATWKRYNPATPSRRKNYLNERLDFDSMTESEVDNDFMNMINEHMVWSDTPQGHPYWREVWLERRAPIRTL